MRYFHCCVLFVVGCVTLVVVWVCVVCCLSLRAACCCVGVCLFVVRCCVCWGGCLLLFLEVMAIGVVCCLLFVGRRLSLFVVVWRRLCDVCFVCRCLLSVCCCLCCLIVNDVSLFACVCLLYCRC